MDIFRIAIEINKFETSIKDSIKEFEMKFRIDMNEISDVEVFIVFLKTFQPNINRIEIVLPKYISDLKLKEMLKSLSILPKKVCLKNM